ncbi:MAG TPA: terminase small subunit [Gemmatimonadales bacterium]|nr:terminase small subunit [Gemmatimonadales bacterium]
MPAATNGHKPDAKSYRLTSKQAAFVRGVAQGKNATEAAKDARYSSTYANRQAFQLLDNPRVQAALAELTAKIAGPEIALAAERQAWWSTVMRDKATEMKDRLRASELLAKAQGDFIEQHQHAGAVTVRVVREDPAVASD